jgi:hypothetical protein
MIDWNWNGREFRPTTSNIPSGKALVDGEYEIPADAKNIKIKITDLLSESYEEVING